MADDIFQIKMLLNDGSEQMIKALRVHTEQIKESIQQGVDQAAANLANTISSLAREEADKCIRAAISKTVNNYFSFGDGSKIVRQGVEAAIAKACEALGK